MKRENYKKVVVGVRSYAKTVGDEDEHQADDANAVYAVQHEKLGVNRINYHACFGKMQVYRGVAPSFAKHKPLAVFIQVQKREDLSEEALFHYLEWLLNMSPWRHAFVSKSVRKVLRDRVIVVDPEQPSNYMANAMMAARQAWENYSSSGLYKRINLWWDVAKHVNPTIAFAVTHMGLSMYDGSKGQLGIHCHGHTCLPYDDTNTALFNFVKEHKNVNLNSSIAEGMPDEPDKPWSETFSYKSHPSRIWRGLKPTINLIDETAKAVRAASDGSKKKINPFTSNITPYYKRELIAQALINAIPEWEKSFA